MQSLQFLNAVNQACSVLQQGGIILYPTDTVWGLGCDATNPVAVQSIYTLKQRRDSKALITLAQNQAQLQQYVTHIPTPALPYLQNTNSRPTTIIYPQAMHLAPNLLAANGSVGIRIPNNDFCQALLQAFQKPIVSTSANISGQATPLNFTQISLAIKQGVNYVVPPKLAQNNAVTKPSRIILLGADNSIQILRD